MIWKRLELVWRKARGPHLSRAEIVAGLRAMGVRAGDLIQVHSSLRSLGYVEGGAAAVGDALLEAVAPGGTVMVPTFNHGSEDLFDLRETRSHNGAISEAFRKRPEAVRSLHPTHAYAAIGPLAEKLCADHLAAGTFGMESPLGRLAQWGGWIILLGVGMNRCTAGHVAEQKAQTHCIGWGQWPRWIRDPQTAKVRTAMADVWRNGPCLIEWDPLERRMRDQGLIQDGQIGPCRVMRMRAMDVVDVGYAMTQEICSNCPTMPYQT